MESYLIPNLRLIVVWKVVQRQRTMPRRARVCNAHPISPFHLAVFGSSWDAVPLTRYKSTGILTVETFSASSSPVTSQTSKLAVPRLSLFASSQYAAHPCHPRYGRGRHGRPSSHPTADQACSGKPIDLIRGDPSLTSSSAPRAPPSRRPGRRQRRLRDQWICERLRRFKRSCWLRRRPHWPTRCYHLLPTYLRQGDRGSQGTLRLC